MVWSGCEYKLGSDDECPFCLNPVSVEHTFLYCQESKEFFSKTLRCFNEYHKENVQLSNKQRLFNTFNDSFNSMANANAEFNSKQTLSIGFSAKEILVYLQQHWNETYFRWIFTEAVWTILHWKSWQRVLNMCDNWQVLDLPNTFMFIVICFVTYWLIYLFILLLFAVY